MCGVHEGCACPVMWDCQLRVSPICPLLLEGVRRGKDCPNQLPRKCLVCLHTMCTSLSDKEG